MTRVVAILASGPSLTPAAVDVVRRAGVRSIVTNDTWRLMPDASALFAADAAWWQAHPEAQQFAGEKYVSEDQRIAFATYVQPEPPKDGGNSALRAAHLAYQQGAKLILLLGVDLRDDALTHWHGPHTAPALHNPTDATFRGARAAWSAYADSYARPDVINCSPVSALDCFRKLDLEAALREEVCA